MATPKPELHAYTLPGSHAHVAEVVVFGKVIQKSFGTASQAAAFAREWGEHLDREWMNVRKTSSIILELFRAEVGVSQPDADVAGTGVLLHIRQGFTRMEF